MTPAEKVDQRWESLLQRSDLRRGVPELIRSAHARRFLRRLFPFLSLGWYLRFRRSTESPYTWDYPYAIHIEGDEYEARAGDGYILQRGELERVLDAVVAALPEVEEPVTDELPEMPGDDED